jgi:CheY-like chemotaxis protein
MTLKTLIIDDDPVMCMIHNRVLKEYATGSEMHTFNRAQDALHFLEDDYGPENHYLLLLDICMPVMNGFEFLKAIAGRFSGQNLKVIMVSSSIDPADRLMAFSFHHVAHYMVKPLRPAELGKIRELAIPITSLHAKSLWPPAKGNIGY